MRKVPPCSGKKKYIFINTDSEWRAEKSVQTNLIIKLTLVFLVTASSLTAAAAAAKSLQSCPTLRDPIDGSPPGSPVPGILQARTLEWVAISFSNAWKWKVKVKSLSCVRLLATPWTAAYQDPPSMGFSRQEYWSGVPLPSLSSLTTPSLNSSALSVLHKFIVSLSKGIRAPCSGHLLGSSFLSRCLCTWKNSIKCICFYPASLSWKFVNFQSSQEVKENSFLSLYHLALISTLIDSFE